jgi:hypothetical protein
MSSHLRGAELVSVGTLSMVYFVPRIGLPLGLAYIALAFR